MRGTRRPVDARTFYRWAAALPVIVGALAGIIFGLTTVARLEGEPGDVAAVVGFISLFGVPPYLLFLAIMNRALRRGSAAELRQLSFAAPVGSAGIIAVAVLLVEALRGESVEPAGALFFACATLIVGAVYVAFVELCYQLGTRSGWVERVQE